MNEDVVDQARVAQLLDDVGVVATAGMIDRFLDMLPARLSRLRQAVTAVEDPELRDVALSLGCSATMLGAHRLADASRRCHSSNRPSAHAALAQVEQLAPATCRALVAARPQLSGSR